ASCCEDSSGYGVIGTWSTGSDMACTASPPSGGGVCCMQESLRCGRIDGCRHCQTDGAYRAHSQRGGRVKASGGSDGIFGHGWAGMMLAVFVILFALDAVTTIDPIDSTATPCTL